MKHIVYLHAFWVYQFHLPSWFSSPPQFFLNSPPPLRFSSSYHPDSTPGVSLLHFQYIGCFIGSWDSLALIIQDILLSVSPCFCVVLAASVSSVHCRGVGEKQTATYVWLKFQVPFSFSLFVYMSNITSREKSLRHLSRRRYYLAGSSFAAVKLWLF